jgi:hypothetical protein
LIAPFFKRVAAAFVLAGTSGCRQYAVEPRGYYTKKRTFVSILKSTQFNRLFFDRFVRNGEPAVHEPQVQSSGQTLDYSAASRPRAFARYICRITV